MNVTIGLNDDSFVIPIPNRQPVQAIGEWVGWRRLPSGHYVAPLYVSSVLSVRPAPGMTISWANDAAQVRDDLLKGLENAKRCLADPKPSDLGLRWPTPRRPRKHQLQAIHAAKWLKDDILLADDMGIGKTATALWILNNTAATRAIVICPVSVKFNWASEFALTLGEEWQTHVIDGSAKKRADQLIEATSDFVTGLRLSNKHAIIINYDLLLHLTDDQMALLVRFAEKQAVIGDESHYLKNKKAERTQKTKQIIDGAGVRILMSGTPQRKHSEDYFTQASFVKPGIWSSYNDFKRRYVVEGTIRVANGAKEQRIVVGGKNVAELNAVLNTFMIRRRKSEVDGLPPKVHTYPEITLDATTRKLYVAMRDFARVELSALIEDTPSMSVFDPRARSAIEAALRCEQIAQGFVGGIPEPVMDRIGSSFLKEAAKIPGRPNELIFPGAPKLIWLLETIDTVLTQGGAPLVLTRFNAPMSWLSAELTELGINNAYIHGGVPAHARYELVNGFRDKQFDVLISQVKIAEGWSATRSQDVLFLGRDWSPAVNSQAEDRPHREGQKGTVNIQIPIVRGTVEERMHKKLQAEAGAAEAALKELTVKELMEML